MATSNIEKLSPNMYLFFKNTGANCVRRSRMCERAFSRALSLGLMAARFQGCDVREQFFFEVQQEQAHAGAVNWVTRHQLRMRKTLIDVLIDDVGFIQNEIALDQDGHLTVWDSSH